jgi:hypothetical protein
LLTDGLLCIPICQVISIRIQLSPLFNHTIMKQSHRSLVYKCVYLILCLILTVSVNQLLGTGTKYLITSQELIPLLITNS